jgi:RNA polymerase sigma-70 factor (ECF subfamily)
VAQDVLVTAWHKLAVPQQRPEGALVEWLFGIARNKCKQAYRNRSRRHAIEQAFTAEIRERAHAKGPAAPGEVEAAAEGRGRLHTCLMQLRDTDRILLTLWYWKDLPVGEIAAIMGKSEAAVRKQLLRAQHRLKELMHALSET